MSSLSASIKRIGSKTTKKRWRHRFPHYKPMGAFCCYGNQSFDPICPKTLCILSPTPVMLHIISDQDWPNGFRDIQVWTCGRRRRRTDDGPLVYYKLTLWAFGSGELKTGPAQSFPTLTSESINLVQKLGYLGGEKLGRPILSPPRLVKVSTFPCHEYANSLCFLGGGDKLGRPILSPPWLVIASIWCRS